MEEKEFMTKTSHYSVIKWSIRKTFLSNLPHSLLFTGTKLNSLSASGSKL